MSGVDATIFPMANLGLVLIFVVVALAAGITIGWLLRAGRAAASDRERELSHQAALAEAQQQLAVRSTQLDAANAALADALHRVDLANDQIERARLDAEAHASAAAEKVQAQLQQEGKVLTALAPVKSALTSMQQKIADLESQRQTQYGTLSEQLAAARRSDEALRNTTNSLAAALKSNATRGAWGEAQLRNIVESAGLTERVDFEMQQSFTTDEGRKRPDMILHIPGGKALAVDAKVPFAAFIAANEIPETATGEALAQRNHLLEEHVKALRKHIDQLSSKSYWELVDASPEFVVAFVPSESLLSAALSTDPGLLDYAFDKRVVLASPVTLWSVLKTVAFMWRQEDLTSEAKEIIALAKELYGRIATMSGHTEHLRKALDGAVKAFNQFSSTLEHRVLVTARKLDKVDASKAIEAMSPIERPTQALTALEFIEQEDMDEPDTEVSEVEGTDGTEEPGTGAHADTSAIEDAHKLQ